MADPNSVWRLDHIQLKSAQACAGNGLDCTFYLNDWVTPSSQVALFPKASGSSEYEVVVFTSDLRGAGTDGLVDIMVCAPLLIFICA